MIKCIVSENPLDLAVSERNLTIKDSLINGKSMLSLVSSEQIEEKNIIKIISSLAIRTSGYFSNCNYTKQMSQFLAFDILDKHKFESIEDIVLIFKMGRRGDFSNKFDKMKFDNSIILNTWVPGYLSLKSREREKILHNQKIKSSGRNEKIVPTEEAKAFLKKIRLELKAKSDKKEGKNKTVFSNSSEYITFIKENCPSWTNTQLTDLIEKWKRQSHTPEYFIEPLEEELKKRKNEGKGNRKSY